MISTLGRLCLALIFVAVTAVSTFAAPVTLRFSGNIEDVVRPEDAPWEDTSWWTDLSALLEGMPWQLTVTYDSDAVGNQLIEPADPAIWGGVWSYDDAVTAASFVVGPYAYSATSGDIFTNYGLPYGIGPDPLIVGLGQVQFEFNPGLWVGAAGSPAIWEGNMIVSYNDTGAVDGTLPEFLDVAPFQGLQSHLLWERIPAAGGGGQFYSAHGQIAVEQIAAVPEPTTLALLGGGIVALIARRTWKRR
jgi:hypothetical protein